ncbi:uncharacterized protein M421DRAFT_72416 [Didymella exigua CBS 183.55]|uniref:C2H2-type domain-containing protein n=1 Tax=Didymella exigua CBS 183.55 TaxID=1150837 RepID=A0A6A5R9S6_9PLEO|nr:uncharacterized protein M421DRAFT_72416 [Didymella exigua CBS 183.55]KAF1924492.1 hypothetical protein M421DRAFT_72416 [Didymella exigua CBS 183.55]
MDSPASDLSDYASDDFPDEVKGRRLSNQPTPDAPERPSKRLRLNKRAPSSPPPAAHAIPPATLEDLGALSEDTDGSVPASPNHHPGMSQDDDFGQEQVTACKWEGCDAGDLDNMDQLVEHLHDDHIGTRQKKYSCEWSDCTRKGIPHASGYALRAHMRSHTREKPFYCTLPECDRSFTRSDALAKHMRTVHETEALRPSDPVPKHHSSNPLNKFQRIKLVLSNEARPSSDSKASTPASPSSLHPPPAATLPPALAATLAPAPAATLHPAPADAAHAANNVTYIQDLASPGAPVMVQFPPDISLTQAELALPADQLFHALRRTLQFATDEGEALRRDADALEKTRKLEWDRKQLLLENYMEMQLATAKRHRLDRGDEQLNGLDAAERDVRTLHVTPIDGKLPWWREDPWESILAGRPT